MPPPLGRTRRKLYVSTRLDQHILAARITRFQPGIYRVYSTKEGKIRLDRHPHGAQILPLGFYPPDGVRISWIQK